MHNKMIAAAKDSKKPDFACTVGMLNKIAQGLKTGESDRIGARFATEADLTDGTIIKVDYAGRHHHRGGGSKGDAAIQLKRIADARAADDRKRNARETATAAADARVEDAWAERVYGPGASDSDDMVSV